MPINALRRLRQDYAMIATVSAITVSNVASFGSSLAPARIAGHALAAKLIEAEAAIDAAIAAVAALTAAIPAASQEAQVGMHVGQQALMHAMESCQQLVKSRTNIIRTHSALRTAQETVGLGTVNFSPKGAFDCHQPRAEDATAPMRLSAIAA
jgi:hypothetical protein